MTFAKVMAGSATVALVQVGGGETQTAVPPASHPGLSWVLPPLLLCCCVVWSKLLTLSEPRLTENRE